MSRTLIISPHLDDESISCGGLIQHRIAHEGYVDVLTVFGRKYAYAEATPREISDELDDYAAASKILGVRSSRHTLLPEGEPQQEGYYKLLREVENALSRHYYTEVIIPGAKDLNQDHRHLHHVCRIALRPINLGTVTRVLEFIALDGVPQAPNYYVALTEAQVQKKLQAVAAYRRESRGNPSPRSPDNMVAQMRVWGAASGHAYAEAYKVKLEIS